MAMFKDFTFDGENSKDYGVYISGDAVYDAPERAMDMVHIPGRNGALALDNGYYNNIDVTYPAGCFADDQADFAAKLSRIRNMLASRHRYCRLEDAYHPDHFRMALYKSGLDVAPVARNKAGRFNITFDAKPQRFLKSGEVVQELDSDAPPTTSYGPAGIVTFEGEPGDAIVHGQWPLEPVQDLHGYDSPWPAGGGKNLLNPSAFVQREGYSNLQASANGNVISVTGYDAGGRFACFVVPLIIGQIYTYKDSARTSIQNCILLETDTEPTSWINGGTAIGTGSSYTFTATKAWALIKYELQSDATITDAQIELGSTATSYTPYSNICPITGFTGAEITDNGFNWLDVENKYASSYVSYSNGIVSNVIVDTRAFFQAAMLASVDGSTWVTIGFFNLTALSLGKHHFTFNSGKYNYVVFKHNGSTRDIYIFNRLRVVKNTSYCISFDLVSQDMSTIGGLALKELNINPSGDRDGEYAPFGGTTHSITWQDAAGTVYGGLLEYLGGQAWRLTETWKNVTYNGSENWTLGGDASWPSYGHAFQIQQNGSEAYSNGNVVVSNMYPEASVYSATTTKAIRAMFQNYILVADPAYTSVADFKTFLASSPLQVVYKLITPVVYDLTGEELQALIGTNNIFSNTGTTTITVQSPYELENPTLYPSKPLIRVYGSGTIQVNDVTITVAEHSGYIDIDCDLMDCYRGADNMNQYVSFSGNDFPELQPGINRILLSGPDKVEITPRWWEL